MDDPKVPRDPARALPARANLEHLRNEAKKRLKETRLRTPHATLADAQLAVARDYGFSSWRKLKSYVDVLHEVGPRLVNAVRNGDLGQVRAILDRSPDLVNATTGQEPLVRPSDTQAMRLIQLAVAENQVDVALLLIERGADPNVRNAEGRLPLHDCFELGRDEFARLLMAAGARADVCMAAGYGMHDQLRALLIEDAARANDLQTGLSPLGWSVYGGQDESARILFAHGAIVDRPPYDWSAWGPAAHVANTKMARVLLAHGADPNCRNREGDTPIHAAIKSRIVRDPSAFIEVLLAAGADRTILNKAGRTALEEALQQVGKVAETYFPARPTGAKDMDRAIELLRG